MAGYKFVSRDNDNDFAKSLSSSGTDDITIKTLDGNSGTISKSSIKAVTFKNDGSMQSIPDYFLCNCENFNNSLTISISNLIGHFFMKNCTAFNSSLTINSCSSIYGGFMYNCTAFNSPLTINSCSSIGFSKYLDVYGFMYNCEKFNQPLTLPSNLSKIYDYRTYSDIYYSYFLFNCKNFNNYIYCPGHSSRPTE
ncbi:hypothetical protein FACS189459_7390 [Bacilli bacterium]|nr:hypothetical protein FACS189459_7390 [Bacilli bacterium]